MKREELFMIVFLGLLTAIGPLSMDMYLPALPVLADEFAITPTAAQLTLTMTMTGMALGQMIGGPLSDKFGRKRPLFVGMFVFTLSSLGCVLTNSISLFLLLRFVQGFFGSFGVVIARAIARDRVSGAALLRFYSILMLINGLAPILAPVIGGQIMRFTTWHTIFLVLTGIAALLAALTVMDKESLPKENRIADMTSAFRSFPRLLRDRFFLGQCLIQGFLFVSFFAYLAGSSFLFQNIYGLTVQDYSLIQGVMGVGLMATGLLPAKLSRTVKEEILLKWSIVISLISSVFLLAGLALALPVYIILPLIFITIVPLSVTETTGLAMALSAQGKNAGSASALMGFFSVAPGGLAMPLAGIGGDQTAIPMGILMLAGYAACLWVFRNMVVQKSKPEPAAALKVAPSVK